jgi:hypothetical protein
MCAIGHSVNIGAKLPMVRTPSEAKLFALLRFQARLTLTLANHRTPKRRRQYCCERMAALDVEIAQARAAMAKEIREGINTVTPHRPLGPAHPWDNVGGILVVPLFLFAATPRGILPPDSAVSG